MGRAQTQKDLGRRVGPRRVGPRKGWGPEGGAPKPKISRFFFPFPPSVNWCCMCTFGVLGLSCASPGGPVWWGRRGFTRQPESSKRAHFIRPSKHHQNSTRRHPERHRKQRNGGGKGKKKSETEGGPCGGGVRRKVVQGSPNQQQPQQHTTQQHNKTITNNNTRHQHHLFANTKTPKLAKVGLAKVGQNSKTQKLESVWPKSVKTKLAKIGRKIVHIGHDDLPAFP